MDRARQKAFWHIVRRSRSTTAFPESPAGRDPAADSNAGSRPAGGKFLPPASARPLTISQPLLEIPSPFDTEPGIAAARAALVRCPGAERKNDP